MQPTVPAWVQWYRRVRGGELVPARRPPARLSVYTSLYDGDTQNLRLIRLEDVMGKGRALPTLAPGWRERLDLANDMWQRQMSKHALDIQQRVHLNYPPVSLLAPPLSAPDTTTLRGPYGTHGVHGTRDTHGTHGPHAAHGGAVWGGWAAGAVLLALLVLIVRAAEKCLDRRLFKTNRRRSEEWPTANVTATSLQHQNIDIGSLPHLDGSEYSPSERSSDLPPPYSECAPSTANKSYNKPCSEEPPPPYSACLVAFANKDIPTVHIQTRALRRADDATHNMDNVHNDLIESHHRVDEHEQHYDEGTMRVELVFDNGRVVERTIDIDNIENVPELVASVGETVIVDSAEHEHEYQPAATPRSDDRVIVV